MKFTLYSSCRRNPLVAAAIFRRAGSHRSNESSRRQQAASTLRRELKEMKNIP